MDGSSLAPFLKNEDRRDPQRELDAYSARTQTVLGTGDT
jgi:hypothetical protein